MEADRDVQQMLLALYNLDAKDAGMLKFEKPQDKVNDDAARRLAAVLARDGLRIEDRGGQGDCFYRALAYQLQSQGSNATPEAVKQAALGWLKNLPDPVSVCFARKSCRCGVESCIVLRKHESDSPTRP